MLLFGLTKARDNNQADKENQTIENDTIHE